jgi:hypothetical protein
MGRRCVGAARPDARRAAQADGPTRVLRLSDVRSRAEADSEQSILDLAARLKQARLPLPRLGCCAP